MLYRVVRCVLNEGVGICRFCEDGNMYVGKFSMNGDV